MNWKMVIFMKRKSKKIEFVKDKVGKLFISASSVVCEDNKTLEDKLKESRLYMISGTKVINVSSSVAIVHTWTEIEDMFENTYGFKPSDPMILGITFTNGDTNASWVTVTGSHMSWNNGYRAVAAFGNSINGMYRINYAYFYNY